MKKKIITIIATLFILAAITVIVMMFVDNGTEKLTMLRLSNIFRLSTSK